MKPLQFTVNEAGIKQLIPQLFTMQYQFLTEMVQNAQRAGATRVDIDFDESSRCLIVTDDGSGFTEDSFHAFFTAAADSSWSEEVMDTQMPFGIGAAALFFAGDEGCIISNGIEVNFNTQAVYDGTELARPTEIETNFKGSMVGVRLNDTINISRLIKSILVDQIFQGFPIPVFFNGKNLPRRFAEGSDTTDISYQWLDAPFGRIGIKNCVHPKNLVDCQAAYFVQGYKLGLSTKTIYSGYDVVVHLNSKLFPARVPDRTTLLDTELSRSLKSDVKSFFLSVRTAELYALADNMSRADFSSKYWFAAKSICPDLIVDLQLPLPEGSIVTLSDLPHKMMEFEDPEIEIPEYNRDALERENAPQFFLDDVHCCFYYDHEDRENQRVMEFYSYAYLAGLPVASNNALPGHWAFERTIDIESQSSSDLIEVTDIINGKEKFISWADYCSANIVLCDSFTLSATNISDDDGNEIELPSVVVTDDTVIIDNVIYIAGKLNDTVVRQYVCCETDDEWSTLMDDDRLEEVTDALNAVVSMHQHNNPAELLRTILCKCTSELRSAMELIGDKSFELSFEQEDTPFGLKVNVEVS